MLNGRADVLYAVNDALGSFLLRANEVIDHLLRANEVIDQVPMSDSGVCECRGVRGMSAWRGRPEVIGGRSNRRD